MGLPAAFALLGLAACSGSSLPEGEDSPATTPALEPVAPADFRDLAERARTGTYKFDFRLLGPSGEEQETGTFYRKPPKFRLDRLLDRSFTTIWRDDELIECEGTEGGQSGCVAHPGEGPIDGLPIVVRDPAGFEIVAAEGRVVAGQRTSCFVAVPTGVTQSPFPQELELCFSPEGALLFQRTKFSAPLGQSGTPGPVMETVREATSYTTTVEDGDFEPPAEPARP